MGLGVVGYMGILANKLWSRLRSDRLADYAPLALFGITVFGVLFSLYQLLPQTNCKGCGEPTCSSFALKLAASQKKIADCPSLSEPAYADRLATLQATIIDAPAMASQSPARFRIPPGEQEPMLEDSVVILVKY